jgi:hypothetical protein
MNPDFQGAVCYVQKILKPYVSGGQLVFPAIEPMEVIFRWELRIVQVSDDLGAKYICPEGAAEWLYSKADHNKGAFDLLCHIVATRLFRNEPLSPQLRTFAGLRVAGEIEPPKSSTKVAKNHVQNLYLICLAYRAAEDFGLTLTRNEVSAALSACDAVAQALSNLGHQRTWRAIKELIVNPSSEALRSHKQQLELTIAKMKIECPDLLELATSQAHWLTGTENPE